MEETFDSNVRQAFAGNGEHEEKFNDLKSAFAADANSSNTWEALKAGVLWGYTDEQVKSFTDALIAAAGQESGEWVDWDWSWNLLLQSNLPMDSPHPDEHRGKSAPTKAPPSSEQEFLRESSPVRRVEEYEGSQHHWKPVQESVRRYFSVQKQDLYARKVALAQIQEAIANWRENQAGLFFRGPVDRSKEADLKRILIVIEQESKEVDSGLLRGGFSRERLADVSRVTTRPAAPELKLRAAEAGHGAAEVVVRHGHAEYAVTEDMTIAEREWAVNQNIRQSPLHHGTTFESYDSIYAEGFKLGKERYGRLLGEGVYLTPTLGKAKDYAQKVITARYIGPKPLALATGASIKGKVEFRRNNRYHRKELPWSQVNALLRACGYGGFYWQSADEVLVFDPQDLELAPRPPL